MRGEILSYDATTGAGLISGDDGARYDFTSDALQSPAVPAAGVRVDFVPEGAVATQILILAGAPNKPASPAVTRPPLRSAPRVRASISSPPCCRSRAACAARTSGSAG